MKGLLLNYEYGMWDAVLGGFKTNTRRAHSSLNAINQRPDDYELIEIEQTKDQRPVARFRPVNGGYIMRSMARYHVGEIVFLQEPTLSLQGFVTDEEMTMYRYRDKEGHTELDAFKMLIDNALNRGARWGNKMFMAEKHARYFVKITRIEVERLQSISENDCIAEGIRKNGVGYYYQRDRQNVLFSTPQKAYFSLYAEINNEPAGNPWVFSYHFELCSNRDGK